MDVGRQPVWKGINREGRGKKKIGAGMQVIEDMAPLTTDLKDSDTEIEEG